MSLPRHGVSAEGKKDKGKSCTIDSVTPVAFGSYRTDSPVPHTSTGTLRFTCTPGSTLTVQVTIGPSGISGSITDRQMRKTGGGDELHYNLFQDQRGSILWGDGVNGGNPAFITGAKNFQAEIYGIMQPLQQASEGVYFDTLRIAVIP